MADKDKNEVPNGKTPETFPYERKSKEINVEDNRDESHDDDWNAENNRSGRQK